MAQQLSKLPIGSKIKDYNTKYYNEPIIWKIADKNHIGYPNNSVTLITDKIITLKCLDAKESGNTNTQRQTGGNNRYTISNIHQWLNSEKNDWYTEQHNADAPPLKNNVGYNPYAAKSGFLSTFSNGFKKNLITTSVTVAKAFFDAGGTETFDTKIFLASTTEVGLPNENDVVEGSKLAIFSDNNSRIFIPSKSSITNDEMSYNKATQWLLRTPVISAATNSKGCDANGDAVSIGNSYGATGILPLCNLSASILVSDTADADGSYTIFPTPTISGADGDIGTKNNKFSYKYTVTDTNSSVTTVQEQLDDTTIKNYTAILGVENSAIIDGVNWVGLAQGKHTLKITAINADNSVCTRTITFTKCVDSLSASLINPIVSPTMPKRINVSVDANLPIGSKINILVCNNGNDKSPSWENATNATLAHNAHIFTNKAKQAAQWGVNIKVEINRNNAIGVCSLSGFQGNFE